jgi:hypothetical protein
MSRRVAMFRGSTGLNNKVDPARIRYDWKTGVSDLAAAYDVDIDDSGMVQRGGGVERVKNGAWHSLFSCGQIDYGLGVIGDALCVIEADYGHTPIRNVTPGARASYAAAGKRVYYANGFEVGYVEDRASFAWVASDYVGPDTERVFSDPPVGSLLFVFNGRMYVAKDDALWHSEPFAYAWFDAASGWTMFDGRIRAGLPVDDGYWLATESKTYWMGGSGPKEAAKRIVFDSPLVEGVAWRVDASRVGKGETKGMAWLAATRRGFFLLGNGGNFEDLSGDRLEMPEVGFGAACVSGERFYASFVE